MRRLDHDDGENSQHPDDRTGDTTRDRRGSERHRAVCRVARVRRADDMGLWLVRNMSDDGMMLAADVEMNVGETLDISLSETVHLKGTIRWVEGGRCGVQLAEPIDAEETLHGLAAEHASERHRAMRLPIDVKASVTMRNRSMPIDLVDISQHGAGFKYHCELLPGTPLEIWLPGIDAKRSALVRWSRGLRGGLWFTEPIGRKALESIEHFSKGQAGAGETGS